MPVDIGCQPLRYDAIVGKGWMRVTPGHREVGYAEERDPPIASRAQLCGNLARLRRNLAGGEVGRP